jgi:lysophospholipase L1-like esterase
VAAGRRRRRRLLVAAAGVPLLAAAVLGAEVEVARRGQNLDDVDLVWEAEGTVPVVWIGDSTAFGVGVTDGADAVASVVARARDERVVNLAVSGATLHDVVEGQLPKVAAHAPARVYVSIGANDVTHLTRSDAFEEDYRRLLRRLPMDADLVVLGVPDMGAPPRLAQPLRAIAGWRGRRLDRIVERLARRHPGATYVDIEGRTGSAFRRDADRLFADDGYHPSAAGYRVWADAVLATVDVR